MNNFRSLSDFYCCLSRVVTSSSPTETQKRPRSLRNQRPSLTWTLWLDAFPDFCEHYVTKWGFASWCVPWSNSCPAPANLWAAATLNVLESQVWTLSKFCLGARFQSCLNKSIQLSTRVSQDWLNLASPDLKRRFAQLMALLHSWNPVQHD